MPEAGSAVSFSEEDLAIFSLASGDSNPLHLSAEYARGTPYGERVVFGCLGAIACLGGVKLPAGWSIGSIQAEFLRPMFLGISYDIAIAEKDGGWVAQLLDGSLPVVSLTIMGALGAPTDSREVPVAAKAKRSEAARRTEAEIVPGLEVSGRYACDPAALSELARRWRVDPFPAAVLCWASYLVGMEIPGESALFFKLLLKLTGISPLGLAEYKATVNAVDSRFSKIRMNVSLAGDRVSGSCWAFIRPALPEGEEAEPVAASGSSLKGWVAIVIGASRGLGAAIKLALDQRGAIVYSLSRTGADEPRAEAGNASDTVALARLRDRVIKEQGRLDLLICNACPPLLPLRLEPNGALRIRSYIDQAVGMTLNPLCLLLDLLNANSGCAVIISSKAAEQPVREWPHYVAAKQAVETLSRVAVMQYPGVRTLIVRPPKLLTTLTNTPGGRRGTISPVLFANRVVARLEDAWAPGQVEILS